MIKPWRWRNKRLLYVLSAPCQGATSAFHILTRLTCTQNSYAPAASAWRLRQSTEQHPVGVYWTVTVQCTNADVSGALWPVIKIVVFCWVSALLHSNQGREVMIWTLINKAKSRGYKTSRGCKTPTTERLMGHLKTVWSIRKHNNSIVELIEPQLKIILGS